MSELSIDELATPAWIVDLERLLANCERMIERAAALGVRLRPHVKTHKTVAGLLCQHLGRRALSFVRLHDGSVDVAALLADEASAALLPLRCCVSTLGEADFFLQSGLPLDVCVAVPCGGDAVKMRKLEALRRRYCSGPAARSRLQLVVDSSEAVDALLARDDDDSAWDVFVNIDTGYHREGMPPDEADTWQLVERLAAAHPRLRLAGLYTHAGNSYGAESAAGAARHAQTERDVIAAFAARVIAAHPALAGSLEVGVGSTPTCSNPAAELAGVTEFHPGNYCYYDLHQAAVGSCRLDDIAGAVLTSVVSRYPSRRRLLVDAGALALSKDQGAAHLPAGCPTSGWAVSPDAPSLKIVSISQEMGVVASVDDDAQPLDFAAAQLQIGSRLRFYPHHSCLAAACFPVAHIVAGQSPADLQLLGIWPCSPRQW